MRSGSAQAWLQPVSGPVIGPLILTGKTDGLVIGRHDQADLRLPNDAVSRYHARVWRDGDQWRIADLKSRWGTYLNGVRLAPDSPIPLQPGDLLRIAPWTFNFSTDSSSPGKGLQTLNDVDRAQTMVRTVTADATGSSARALAEDHLALLLESAAALHAASDEHALAEALLEAATRGSRLPNAAVLRPVTGEGRLEIIAARQTASHEPSFSRSLINAAEASGNVVAFSPSGIDDISQSIVTLQIDAALCVPLLLGSTVAAFLYLDARGASGRHIRQLTQPEWFSISAFCLALGRIASLALANLKRMDVERRIAQAEADLRAAAEAQRFLLPRAERTVGTFRCEGESRPGRHVGGDFFDLIALSENKLAVALGDVSGKGIGASLLMTTAHGFLHAMLCQDPRPDVAVMRLNQFLSPRLPAEKFVTLWVGVFDAPNRTLSYVDAGHGYAYLLPLSAPPVALDAGENVPIGVSADWAYLATTLALPASAQIVIVSDGIIEQPGSAAAAPLTQFGTARLIALAPDSASSADHISRIFQAVFDHAGSEDLADDATAVLVRT